MSEDVSPNKISDKMKRRAEHIQDRLEDKGMGRDEAEKRAVDAATSEGANTGGANSAGDPKQGHNYEGNRRNGSDH